MKIFSILAPYLLIILCYCSCKNSTTATKKMSIKKESISDVKKTQALLLTQAFDFDSSDINKVTGDYVPQTVMTVPENLAAQNKWIMFEGPVLENDLVAYRYYADSRHRFDVYGKTVPDLVMDTVSWNYHEIMDWGSDILKVGNSLGLGSPAIWYKNKIHTLSECDEKKLEIINNDDNISKVRTTFIGLEIGEQKFDLIQDWSIEAGQAWSEIHLQLVNAELPEGMYFATGIVKHLPEIIQGEIDGYFYAMNWGKQSFHKENMGMAVLADKRYQAKKIEAELSHAYAFYNVKKEVKYRFLSAWERDLNQVKDATTFKSLVEQSIK